MKKVVNYLLAAAATVAVAASCTKQGNPLSYEGSTVVEFTADGGTKVITVKSDADITLTPSAKWIKATNVKNDITIAVGAVPDETSRHGELTVSNGVDTPIVFEIKQEGGKFTFAPQTEYTVSLSGGTIEIPYETNYEFTIKANDSWLSVEKKSGKVVLTAPAATAARTTKVTYEAGSNAGEFTVKQYNPVSATLTTFLQEDASRGYYKYNTIWYTLKGTDITSGRIACYDSTYVANTGDETIFDNIAKSTTIKDFTAAQLQKVNGTDGLSGGYVQLNGGAAYTVCAIVSNGSDTKYLKSSIRTEGNPDPIQNTYTEEDLYLMDSPVGNTYDVYSNGGIFEDYSMDGTLQRFGKRVKLGSCTFTKAGTATYAIPEADSLSTSGFVKAFTDSQVDRAMTHYFYIPEKQYGLIYCENFSEDYDAPTAGQFYEVGSLFGYEGSNQYQSPLLPFYAGVVDDAEKYVVYWDGGYGENKGIGALDHMFTYLMLLKDNEDPDKIQVLEEKDFGLYWDIMLVRQTPAPTSAVTCTEAPENYYESARRTTRINYVEDLHKIARETAIRNHIERKKTFSR